MRPISRRHALRLVAACAAATATAPLLRVLPCIAAPCLPAVHEERLLLGTIVGMTALAPSRQQAHEALEAAFATVRRLEGVFSRYQSATPLASLNTAGRLTGIPQELVSVLDHGLWLHRATAGHFDMTVAPLLDLMERTHGQPHVADLRQALELVDSSRVRLTSGTVTLAPDMAITLDGVAKGYIADQAAETLRRHGIEHFLVDAGGDLRVEGSPEGHAHGRPWTIAIEDPDKRGRHPATIHLRQGAVATSGGYERSFDGRGLHHHLLDPHSGRSPQHVRSVSVVAPTVMEADGLATALAVMPPRQALALVDRLAGCACLLVTSSGAVLASPGWPS